ncbi:hypothetical protein COCCADRAFT_98626, partial [Bipolaris zeicola 26-R-13]
NESSDQQPWVRRASPRCLYIHVNPEIGNTRQVVTVSSTMAMAKRGAAWQSLSVVEEE